MRRQAIHMAEHRSLESWFLWGLTGFLAFIAILHWAVYFIGPPIWMASWHAIPLTAGAIAAGIGAFFMRRRGEKVRLVQR